MKQRNEYKKYIIGRIYFLRYKYLINKDNFFHKYLLIILLYILLLYYYNIQKKILINYF